MTGSTRNIEMKLCRGRRNAGDLKMATIFKQELVEVHGRGDIGQLRPSLINFGSNKSLSHHPAIETALAFSEISV
jgi:hypothetical protein